MLQHRLKDEQYSTQIEGNSSNSKLPFMSSYRNTEYSHHSDMNVVQFMGRRNRRKDDSMKKIRTVRNRMNSQNDTSL